MDSNKEQEDQAFRKFRENTTGNICPICYDERPNIMTLCCGQGVCITCMTRWLSENKTCHNCRAQMSFRPTSSSLKSPAYDNPLRPLPPRGFSWTNFPNITHSTSIVTRPHSTNTPIRRMPGSTGNNNDVINILPSTHPAATSSSRTPAYDNPLRPLPPRGFSWTNFPNITQSTSIVTRPHSINTPIRRMPGSTGNNNDVINIFPSTHPAATSSSRTWCFSPFEEYLRRIFGNLRNVSGFVSPQEFRQNTSFSMTYSDASFDDEDSDDSLRIPSYEPPEAHITSALALPPEEVAIVNLISDYSALAHARNVSGFVSPQEFRQNTSFPTEESMTYSADDEDSDDDLSNF